MARITVEDCVDRVPNQFDLVMIAAQRAKQISAGAQATVERNDDKNPVVALREIAGGLELESLVDSIVRGKQKFTEVDQFDEDILDELSEEQGYLVDPSSVGEGYSVEDADGDAVDDDLSDDFVDEGDDSSF